MTALPAAATKVHMDAATDDPEQARTELATLVDLFNQMRDYNTGLLGTDGLPATGRSTLGLGTAAVAAIGTSGNAVPKLNAANEWSADQTLTNAKALMGKETGGTARILANVSALNEVAIGDAAAPLLLRGNGIANAAAAAVDNANDKIPIFDASAGAFRHVTPSGLGVGGGGAWRFVTKRTASASAELLFENFTSDGANAYMFVGYNWLPASTAALLAQDKWGGAYKTSLYSCTGLRVTGAALNLLSSSSLAGRQIANSVLNSGGGYTFCLVVGNVQSTTSGRAKWGYSWMTHNGASSESLNVISSVTTAAGYDTNVLQALRFKMATGNITAGVIDQYALVEA